MVLCLCTVVTFFFQTAKMSGLLILLSLGTGACFDSSKIGFSPVLQISTLSVACGTGEENLDT